jgi:hypothetical protein
MEQKLKDQDVLLVKEKSMGLHGNSTRMAICRPSSIEKTGMSYQD